ncbi:MAG: hypothetical protein V3S14_03820 [Anaerolineae bacterium]
MADARILIIEDEALTATRLKRTLTKLGYAVPEMTNSGEEAFQKVDEMVQI